MERTSSGLTLHASFDIIGEVPPDARFSFPAAFSVSHVSTTSYFRGLVVQAHSDDLYDVFLRSRICSSAQMKVITFSYRRVSGRVFYQEARAINV